MTTVSLVILHILRLATEVQDSGILVYWETIVRYFTESKILFQKWGKLFVREENH